MMPARHRHVSAAGGEYKPRLDSFNLVPDSIPNTPHDSIAEPTKVKMTTLPLSDGSAVTSLDSKPHCCANTEPNVTLLSKPPSVQQEQGDLPDLTSLQMIISDPVTACHGCPVQQAVFEVERAELQDRRAEDLAVAPAGDSGALHDADRAAPTPRYRPAYELADAAHERLGRGTHPPVLNA